MIEGQRERSFVRIDEALKIMCCSKALDPHPGEIPMWGYYADCHRGVRIHFRSSFYTQAGVEKPEVIVYDEAPVKFGFHETIPEGMRRFIEDILRTKSDAWRHEAEVRLVIDQRVLWQAEDSRKTVRWWLAVKPEHVSRIDLGVKFNNPDLLEELRKEHPTLPIFQACKNAGRYLCDYCQIAP